MPDDPPDRRLPLRLAICTACGLAQLADDSPAEADDPSAPSPTSSATMAAHARAFVDDLVDRGLATPEARILSVASHGGYLAPFLWERGLEATILEGSPERASRLAAEGRRVVAAPLDGTQGPGVPAGSFDLIVDSFLLAHLGSPRVAVERLAGLLAPGGTLVLEFDHLAATVEGGQWDAVRHGHHLYLTLGWLAADLARVGLRVVDAVPQPVYGGALRVVATAGASPGASARQVLEREAAAGIGRPEGLEPLRAAVKASRSDVVAHLRDARASGRLVVGYGAPGRGTTFLNAVDVGPDLVPFVVDRSPAKQGRMIPGVRIPIHDLARLATDPPDEVLILTWDLAQEVTASIAPFVRPATRFLVAMPHLAEVGPATGMR